MAVTSPRAAKSDRGEEDETERDGGVGDPVPGRRSPPPATSPRRRRARGGPRPRRRPRGSRRSRGGETSRSTIVPWSFITNSDDAVLRVGVRHDAEGDEPRDDEARVGDPLDLPQPAPERPAEHHEVEHRRDDGRQERLPRDPQEAPDLLREERPEPEEITRRSRFPAATSRTKTSSRVVRRVSTSATASPAAAAAASTGPDGAPEATSTSTASAALDEPGAEAGQGRGRRGSAARRGRGAGSGCRGGDISARFSSTTSSRPWSMTPTRSASSSASSR